MQSYTIPKASAGDIACAEARNGKMNNGHNLELAMHIFLTGENTYTKDNKSYRESDDICGMELKAPRANIGELLDGENIFQFAKRRAYDGKADIFAVGLDRIYPDKWVIIELDREALIDFIMTYGYIGRGSRDHQHRQYVTLHLLKNQKWQDAIWVKYGMA